MARTVKVGLDVEEGPFVRGVDRAAKSAEKLEDALDDVSGSARDTTVATDRAKESTEDLGGSAKDAGKDLNRLRSDAQRLDRQIDETAASVRSLAREIAAASDEATRADLAKKLSAEQGKLRERVNLRKLIDVDSAGDLGEELAEKASVSFVARLGPLLASAPLGPAGAALGGTLGLAMAPVLTAAVSGAVVGGAGVGGIVGGVALAARDARVQAAGADLGAFILGDLEKRSAGFVPVVLDGIDDIRAGWGELGPDLSRIFASSRLVDPLVAGMVSGSQKLIHGVADAVDAADPVVSSFGTLLDGVGDAAGDAFTTLSQDADEGASAIEDLTTAVTSFIRVSAGIVHAGATVKGWADQVDIAIDKGRHWTEDWMSSGGVLEHFGIQLDLTADGFKAGTAEAEAYRQATEGTANVADFATLKLAGMTDAEIAAADASGTFRMKTDEVNAALGVSDESYRNTTQSIEEFTTRLAEAFELQNQGITANLSAEQANLRLEAAIDKATAAGKANNDGISVNTEKGRANREALLGVADAAITAAEKIHATTGSTELASAATERGRAKFLEAAGAMGVEKKEAIELANKLFGIPSEVNTKADFSPDNKGVTNWKNTLSGIPREIFTSARLRAIVNIETRREQATEATGRRWGGITEHARDGLLRDAGIYSAVSPARYAFAEPATGGEAFIPRFGDPDRSVDILSKAARWYGQAVVPASGVGGSAGGGVPEVRVFIGDRELTDIVDVQISTRDRQLKRRVSAGAGR
ncbi:hypothetical protein PSN13_06496 [Micromonospora saelicesensis]|uniref:Uncharacterized protein n=1 Tax=Micromonospora saelicesensis TaxID=285676 RepID=A0A328NCR3_9ACTN|nr:hypothetical protein [Micromonospora saelicesensis]RAO26468.1 hypothetical protein PSN13_06496 [Micromonospora saelicesensis]